MQEIDGATTPVGVIRFGKLCRWLAWLLGMSACSSSTAPTVASPAHYLTIAASSPCIASLETPRAFPVSAAEFREGSQVYHLVDTEEWDLPPMIGPERLTLTLRVEQTGVTGTIRGEARLNRSLTILGATGDINPTSTMSGGTWTGSYGFRTYTLSTGFGCMSLEHRWSLR